MAIALGDEELWTFVEAGHTGILTTLRRDGRPVPLPVWFVVIDRRILVTTPRSSAKVTRISHDDRAAFLVEFGTVWRELRAAMLPVRAALVDDPDIVAQCVAAMATKYGAYRTAPSAMAGSARHRYADMVVIELIPDGDPLSWDNARLGTQRP